MTIKRKNTALTFHIEKRLLDWLSKRAYQYTTADQLTLLALIGAIISGFGYYFAAHNLLLLHLSNTGLFLHWFGDSLDGRVARLRGENRPNYGHYVDHVLDAISLVIIIFGITYSGLTTLSSWVWVLALFLLLMIHSFLKASVTGVFELSFERFGPTEGRVGLILINLIVIATQNQVLFSSVLTFNVLDLAGTIGACILLFHFIKAVSSALWGRYKIKEV